MRQNNRLTGDAELGNISLTAEEDKFLREHCSYLTSDYVDYLKEFRLHPREQVSITFHPVGGSDDGSDSQLGDTDISIKGKWVETILYEIPILALTSEAYFKFMDTDWDYKGQEEAAFEKGIRLLEAGCVTSEFGTRRRRDYHTQALVFRGLVRAADKAKAAVGGPGDGKLSGTSNVHLAMRFGIPPVGTVAHEWFMGTAAVVGDYQAATEEALRRWVACFGPKLSIALTDTFGTPEFLKAFSKPVQGLEGEGYYDVSTLVKDDGSGAIKSYAELFAGVRQDSGDPEEFVRVMRAYYDSQGIDPTNKTIVFSDSLNIDRCLVYKKAAEAQGFKPTFGVGTFLTNDFTHRKNGTKSVPLNIVIKLSSANGRPAIKLRYVFSLSSL